MSFAREYNLRTGLFKLQKCVVDPRKSDRVLTVLLPFSSHFRVKIPKNRLLLYRERDFWTGKFIKLYHEIVKSDSYYSKKLWNFNLSSISNKIRNSDFRKPLRKHTFGTLESFKMLNGNILSISRFLIFQRIEHRTVRLNRTLPDATLDCSITLLKIFSENFMVVKNFMFWIFVRFRNSIWFKMAQNTAEFTHMSF